MAYFLTKSFIYCLILSKACSFYQTMPTYWYHFSIPRMDTLSSVSTGFSVLPNITLLECTIKCHFETGGRCVAYNYYTVLKYCQFLDNYGIGFQISSSPAAYYQVRC